MDFATIRDGRLHLELHDGSEHTFQINDDGQHQLRELFQERGITSVSCSSSLDFPTDYGAPEIDMHEWLGKAFGPPPMEIGVKVLKAMVRSLKDGHTDKVIETVETWLRIHEEVYGG